MRWSILPRYQLLQESYTRDLRVSWGTLFVITVLYGVLLLHLAMLACHIEKRSPCRFEDIACLQPTVIQAGHIFKITIYQHLTDTAWQLIEKAGKSQLREVLRWNAGDQYRASLSGGGVGVADEVILAYANVMFHLGFDVVPNPHYSGYQQLS